MLRERRIAIMGAQSDDVRDDLAALIGATVAGKYLVEEVIGLGGMGTVYRARQLSLERPVALKVLHPRCSRDPQYAARFRVEALAASRLDHPNFVRILDFGDDPTLSDPPLLFLTMELVAGRTLLEVIERDWPLPHRRTVDLLSQVLSALAVAHQLGIVHRDLKPENVLVSDGEGDDGQPVEVAKVWDFGIAKIVDTRRVPGTPGSELGRITQAGTVVGTPDYFSPEQARAEPLDARSDLYAAGVVLYYMLSGRLPFVAASPLAVSYMQVTHKPPPPSRFVALPPAIEAVCLKALAKDPQDRYQSAREMRAALRACALPGAGTATAITLVKAGARRVGLPAVTLVKAGARLLGARSSESSAGYRGGAARWRPSFRLKLAAAALAATGAVTVAAIEPWLQPSVRAAPGTPSRALAAPHTSVELLPLGAPTAGVARAHVLPNAQANSKAETGTQAAGTPDPAATGSPRGERRPRRARVSADQDGVLPPSFMTASP